MNPHPETYLKIHLAGYYTGKSSEYTANHYPYFLESYHYIGSGKQIRLIKEDNRKIFLDSGAFSMFTKGIKIPLEKYVEFIKNNSDIIEVASVMDGIGDPKLTFENQKKLEDMGAEVLPCFHYGEPVSYLEYYLEHYNHITLGGMVPISTPDLYQWLDFIWENYLTDAEGYPTHKVHGFGLTILGLMKRYPWYSVDSTSWVLTGRFGSIYMSKENGTEFKLTVSDQSPKVKSIDAHFDTLSKTNKDYILEKINSKGYNIEELRSIYWKRDLWNIDYFKDLCDLPLKPFVNEEQGLFDAF